MSPSNAQKGYKLMWRHTSAERDDSALFTALATHHSFPNLFINVYKNNTKEGNFDYSKFPILSVLSAAGWKVSLLSVSSRTNLCHVQLTKRSCYMH